MIEYIKGDMFETTSEAIGHGCNAQGVMGSGIAKVVRDEYPEAYNVYRATHQNHGLELGTCIPVWYNGKLIVNMITQEYYGREKKRYASYDAIANSMTALTSILNMYDLDEVTLPKIGCGLGNADWDVVDVIIRKYLLVPKIKVYEL